MHAARDDELNGPPSMRNLRATPSTSPASDRPCSASSACATASPPAATSRNERRALGADRQTAARDRLEEIVHVAHADSVAERPREGRVRARGLAHARARPQGMLDDRAGAAELAEAQGHRPRRLSRIVAPGGHGPRAG